jgi:hypothetical protein
MLEQAPQGDHCVQTRVPPGLGQFRRVYQQGLETENVVGFGQAPPGMWSTNAYRLMGQ